MTISRQKFITAQASEKVVLAHIHATHRLITWSVDVGSKYVRPVEHYVVKLKQDQTQLAEASSYATMVEGSFFYDANTGLLCVWCTGSADPSLIQMIATYRFFYSNAPIALPHDLTTAGNPVPYSARIKNNPGYKHKVGIEQGLTSLIGSGDLVLENNDGGLDSQFDRFYFENQLVEIFSYNRELALSDKKKIYRGKVTNKSYDGMQVKFTIKDQIFDLEQNVPQELYLTDFNVKESIQSRYKRIVYGKVEGVQLQSINQIGEGYTITGTLSADLNSETLTGSGTLFLSEVSPDDAITINGEEFTIKSIESDTSLTLDDSPEVAFTGKPGVLVPSIPTRVFNREFLVAGHACSRIAKTVVANLSLNRIQLDSVSGLYVGDFLELPSLERAQIKNFNGNIVILTQNVVVAPAVSATVYRQPVESVYVRTLSVLPESYTITNLGAPNNYTKITFNSDIEFQLARTKSVPVDLTFTNGSRVVTTAGTKDLTTIFKSRDFLRPNDVNYTTYYEVLQVEESQLYLRQVFSDPNYSGASEAKFPDYIGDDTTVSATVYGKTVDGEPDGEWLKTAAQCARDMVSSIEILNVNETSFTEASQTANQIVGIVLPSAPNGKLSKTKDVIDKLNKSVFASLTLDNNLDVQYRVLQSDIPSAPVVIKDSDVIDWKISATNGKTYRNIVLNYRFKDIDHATQESGNLIQVHSSDFVRDYIGTDKTEEYDAYLYDDTEASIMAHRLVYFNSLGRSDVTIKSDLRLEDVQIGDTVQLEFDRLYPRLGDNSRKKLMKVIGLTKTGESLTIEATDLGNIFNTTAVITPNDAPDYVAASVDEKIKYGYITDSRGIVNEDESTSNTNLIS